MGFSHCDKSYDRYTLLGLCQIHKRIKQNEDEYISIVNSVWFNEVILYCHLSDEANSLF